MIDSKAIAEAVNQQINDAITEQVLQAIADPAWLESVETKLMMWCQNRIYGKFENIESSAELKQTVKDAVNSLFNDGALPGIDGLVDQDTLARVVDSAVKQEVAGAVEALALDQNWLETVQARASQEMTQRVVKTLNNIDIPDLIKQTVDKNIPTITESLKNNGINDTAQELELTVMDGYVVAENKLVSKDIEAINGLTVKNLAVTGSINTDNASWDELKADIATKATKRFHRDYTDKLVNSVKESIKVEGLDLDCIYSGREKLVNNDTLSNSIKHSQLNSVGELDSLKVRGNLEIKEDTLHISRNGRVGVNTRSPESALSIWDAEVSINVGKKSAGTAFIGTAKNQDLHIGINNGDSIQLSKNGSVRINHLLVGRNHLGHSKITPGHEGLKGDLLINSEFKPGEPWGWLCLGSYRWQPLYTGNKDD